LRLTVQQKPQGLAAGASPRQEHERDLPVVVLNALSLFGLHDALEASRTMAPVAGMLLVAIQNCDIQTQIQRQRFIPLQPKKST
jgi:hypothetical protein